MRPSPVVSPPELFRGGVSRLRRRRRRRRCVSSSSSSLSSSSSRRPSPRVARARPTTTTAAAGGRAWRRDPLSTAPGPSRKRSDMRKEQHLQYSYRIDGGMNQKKARRDDDGDGAPAPAPNRIARRFAPRSTAAQQPSSILSLPTVASPRVLWFCDTTRSPPGLQQEDRKGARQGKALVEAVVNERSAPSPRLLLMRRRDGRWSCAAARLLMVVRGACTSRATSANARRARHARGERPIAVGGTTLLVWGPTDGAREIQGQRGASAQARARACARFVLPVPRRSEEQGARRWQCNVRGQSTNRSTEAV